MNLRVSALVCTQMYNSILGNLHFLAFLACISSMYLL